MGCSASVPAAVILIGPSADTISAQAKVARGRDEVLAQLYKIAVLKSRWDRLPDVEEATSNANSERSEMRAAYQSMLTALSKLHSQLQQSLEAQAGLYRRRNAKLKAMVQQHKDAAEEARKEMVVNVRDSSEEGRSKVQILQTQIALQIEEATRKAEAVTEHERAERRAMALVAEAELQGRKAELEARYASAINTSSDEIMKAQHQLKNKRLALVEKYHSLWSDAEDVMKAAAEASRKAKADFSQHSVSVTRTKALLNIKLVGLRKNVMPEALKLADEVIREEELAAKAKARCAKMQRSEHAAAAAMHESLADKIRAEYSNTVVAESTSSRKDVLIGQMKAKYGAALQSLQRLREAARAQGVASKALSEASDAASAAKMEEADRLRSQIADPATRESLKPSLQVQLLSALDWAASSHRISLGERKEVIHGNIAAAFALSETARVEICLLVSEFDEVSESKKSELEKEIDRHTHLHAGLESELANEEAEQQKLIAGLMK